MNLKFQCDGNDISSISSLKSRLDAIVPPDEARVGAMSYSDSKVVRVWAGAKPPSDVNAWITEACDIPDGENLISSHPHLILLALTNSSSGLVAEMHVVHERSQAPVYFQNRSELEGYFADRLVSIQELN